MGRHRIEKIQVHDLWISESWYQDHLRSMPSGCIEWTGAHHAQGYGMMPAWRSNQQQIMTTVHRVAARIAWDQPLESTQMVIHTCSNMGCCNPEHLMLGDRTTINQVMAQNKRYRYRRPARAK